MIELRKLLYRYDEAAELLSVSVSTVRRLAEGRELQRVYVATREPRITAESLRSYVQKRTQLTGSLAEA